MEFCYSKLAAKMRAIKAGGKWKRADADLLPDNVIHRAMDGEQMPLDYAMRVMKVYFSEEADAAIELFQPDTMPEDHEALSFAESREILDNALLGEVMSDNEFLAADAYLHDTKREGVNWAIPAGYVLGHAAGVRSERARMRRKQREQGAEPHESSDSDSGKWSELIEIMNELSGYSAHYVTLLAKLYKGMEESGKVSRRPWYD